LFHSNTYSDLAILYNDESILENHHLAVAFKLMFLEPCDAIPSAIRSTEWQRFRRLVISMVLATDMQKHMSLLASTHTMIETKRVQISDSDSYENSINEKNQSRMTQSNTCPEIIIDTESGVMPTYTETILSNSVTSASRSSSFSDEEFKNDYNVGFVGDNEQNHNENNFQQQQQQPKRLSIKVLAQSVEDKTQVLQMLLHCADLANPTKEFDTYKTWTDKVMHEFWNQGDLEKKLGLSVQAMYDKEKADVINTQLGFLDFIVVPLWEMWIEICPDSLPIVEQLDQNRSVYLKMKEESLRLKELEKAVQDENDAADI